MNPLSRILAAVTGRFTKPRAPVTGIVVRRSPSRDAKDGKRQLLPQIGAWDRTFEEVQNVIAQHERGTFRASGVLADVLDRNPRIYGALNNRALGVVGSPFTILPGVGDQRRAAAVARTLEEDWPLIGEEQLVAEIIRSLVTTGFCLCRILPVDVRGRWVPTLTPWHPSFLHYQWMTDQLMATTADRGLVPVVPGNGEWVLFAAARSRFWMRGVVRCLGLPAEVRKHAVNDWSRWSEKHGLPLTELRVPASKAEDEDTTEWFAQMRDLRSDTTVVSPQGDDGKASYGVNLIEAKDTAWEGFKEQIARQDGDVSIAIEGQNLSTENNRVGTNASSRAGHALRQDLREADAYVIATTFYEQVVRFWAAWNFGDADLAPWAVYDPTPPEDLVQLATTMKSAGDAITAWQTIAATRGLEVDVEELAETFRVPLRKATTTPAPDAPAADQALDDGDPAARALRASARRFLARRRHLHLRAAA
jgi:phage gp29-like protein